MRRALWFGLGVAGAVYVTRWLRRQRERLSPQAAGANLGDMVSNLGKLLQASADEARRAAAEKEAELRGTLAGSQDASAG